MNKKNIMLLFLRKVKYRKLMTKFLINIFDYKELHDYNYIYRIGDNNLDIILDIYDNISTNRFNRYIFSFNELEKEYSVYENDGVFVTVINVFNVKNKDNKLMKLGYLFSLDNDEIIKYANTFLDIEFVKILESIIK